MRSADSRRYHLASLKSARSTAKNIEPKRSNVPGRLYHMHILHETLHRPQGAALQQSKWGMRRRLCFGDRGGSILQQVTKEVRSATVHDPISADRDCFSGCLAIGEVIEAPRGTGRSKHLLVAFKDMVTAR